MFTGRHRIDKLNIQNKKKHEQYIIENSQILTDYQNKKDEYNNHISTINAEKVAMREELRKLHDFLSFVGGNLEKKVSILEFANEEPAANIDADIESATQEEIANDAPFLGNFINRKRAGEYEKNIYYKSLDYKHNLKIKEQATARMGDRVEIAIIYRDILITLRDAIRERIIPEFEYIKAFLVADAVREKYYSGDVDECVKPCRITEYKDTKYNSHYQFVRNAFDFMDLCNSFFSRHILTDLMRQAEITDEDRKEFERSISEIQDKLVLLEENMEVKR